MTLKDVIDRKLVMLVVSPLLRRLGTVAATWLITSGLPSDDVGRLLTAVSALVAVAVDLALAHMFKEKAEQKGARKMLDFIKRTDTDNEWTIHNGVNSSNAEYR